VHEQAWSIFWRLADVEERKSCADEYAIDNLLDLARSANMLALMIIQSHVANGNYEILALVFANLMDSLFSFENRCIFHLEVLNTLTYIWFPKNNISSERLPLLKRKFADYNISTISSLFATF
jgi:hypothetical protein